MNHVATTRTVNETRRFMGWYGTREEDRPACAHARRTGEVGGWLCVKRQHRAGALRSRLSATVQLPCGNSWKLQFQKRRTCKDANSRWRAPLGLLLEQAQRCPPLERLHQWLQTSKESNVAPFGRLDGWSPAQCTSLLDPPRARFWLKLLVQNLHENGVFVISLS